MIQFLITAFLVLIFLPMEAQPTKPKKLEWHYLDLKKDGYYGISLEQAYDLLKGRKSEKVIVAVIDSGIDSLHQDLPFWKNKNEIPNNKIDDDKNGFVDDIIGWNFLGSRKGENLAISISDIYRTYHRFKKDFASKKLHEIEEDQKFTFKEWKRAEEKINARKAKADDELENVTHNYNYFKTASETLTQFLKKDAFTEADLAIHKNDTKPVQESMQIWKKVFAGRTFTNQDFLRDFENYKKELEEYSKAKEEPPFPYRDTLLEDDAYDFTKKHYGNNNMSQHSGWHGTSVSSVIGAYRNNSKGINGIADNVEIMMIRGILGKDEFDKDVALSIRYAVDHGARVINMSFGKYISPDKKWVDEAVEYALSKDVVIVHAAGNDGINIDEDFNYPNAFYISGKKAPHFINVGASGDPSNGGVVASFSNYGKKMVDIFAPGVDVHCNIAGEGTRESSGTSLASPVVAGIAALLRSYFPQLKAAEVIEIIKKSGILVAEKVIQPGTDGNKVNLNDLCETGKIVNAAEAIKMAILYKQ